MRNLQALPLNWNALKIKAIAGALAASIALPFLVHFIPSYQGVPVGAMLLPMFIAPFVAVMVSRFHVGLAAAALAPVLNAAVTGHPAWAFVPVLTLELTVFVSVVYLLKKSDYVSWLSAPLSYLAAKTVSSTLIWAIPALLPNASPIDFWTTSVSNGMFGIVLLALINIGILKAKM